MEITVRRKTKIVCTLGPATDSEEMIKALINEGMNVARMNFSHGDYEEQKARLNMLKKVRYEMNNPVAALLDTKGPEIRLKNFAGGKVSLKAGQEFTLSTGDFEGDETHAAITFEDLYKDVTTGDKILIDDGLIEMEVVSAVRGDIHCRVLNDGDVSNHKGINVPGKHLSLPFISEKDKNDLLFGIENEYDFVAASFTRSADDMREMRNLLDENGGEGIQIIAKIENMEGVNNIDEILGIADGIMVARGDLGVEVPLEEVPVIQKRLIRRARKLGKYVITATQMLDSMIVNPRPTRAEAADVANAVYDGTGAIMLSGETANGAYPVEAVTTMARIALRTEQDIEYDAEMRRLRQSEDYDVTNAIAHATCTTAADLGARAILTVSKSGRTVRDIAKYHPECLIIGGTPSFRVWRQINLCWGVYPLLMDFQDNTDAMFDRVTELSVEHELLDKGDKAVITAGVPVGVSGTTNMIKVVTVE